MARRSYLNDFYQNLPTTKLGYQIGESLGEDYAAGGGGLGGTLYAGQQAIRGALGKVGSAIGRGATAMVEAPFKVMGAGRIRDEQLARAAAAGLQKMGGQMARNVQTPSVVPTPTDYAVRSPSLVGGKPLVQKSAKDLRPGEFYGYNEGYPQRRAVYGYITPGSAGSRQDILQSPIAGTPAPGGGYYTGGKASAGRGTATVSGLTGNKSRMYDEYQQAMERRYPAKQKAAFEAARALPQQMQLQREAMASQERIARGEQEAATGLKREEIAGRVAAAGMGRGTPGVIGDKERAQLYAQAMEQAGKEAINNPMTPEQIDKRAGDIFNASMTAASGAQAGSAGQAQGGGEQVTQQTASMDVNGDNMVSPDEKQLAKIKGVMADKVAFSALPPAEQVQLKEYARDMEQYLALGRKLNVRRPKV